ncbi:MAG TPA: hypothetical protein VKB88_14560 [Bryobacteraceae bacterium]|nr:hypothetical protein [Bryobacteraceae bacterium]
MPLGFVPLLLRELIAYDWKFPAERADLERQFAYLGSLEAGVFQTVMSPFARLNLSRSLEQMDWVNSPGVFSERLSAELWASHQIDAFRVAAVDYVGRVSAWAPDPVPPIHRLVIAVIGQGVESSDYRLFRKLARQGTNFTRIKPDDGIRVLLDAVARRSETYPLRYGHWYIDGGAPAAMPGGVTSISYDALAAPRAAIQNSIRRAYESTAFDPEALRTRMAQLKPQDVGFDSRGDAVLSRFQISLLTEGSGTQIFATTFVQWAAREVLRRAQPLTLVIRFAPRQREKPMNELLAEQQPTELDPQGSLIDADMGAYYTRLNQQRLSNAENSTFLAWFEDHSEAVAIGPSLAPGKRSDAAIDLANLVSQIA